MCNIILIKYKKPQDTLKEDIGYFVNLLRTRGRDNYTCFIPKYDEKSENILFSNNDYETFLREVLKYTKFESILLHSRAIPETETSSTNFPNIYTDGTLYVAHHGIIPNAENIRNNIRVDSEALLTIYGSNDFTLSFIEEWYYESLKKYPRASTEVVYNSSTKLYTVATNFMPLYKYCDTDFVVYSTYKDNNLNFYSVDPYTISIV